MKILSHRGFWTEAAEKNAQTAFERTVRQTFGTETDVRDRLGTLVVAHDPADAEAPTLQSVLDLFEGRGLTLALNVKADGLVSMLGAAMRGRVIDWFAFDMSVPEMKRYRDAGLPYFTRHSDVEPDPVLYAPAAGVWLDALEKDWIDQAAVRRHLDAGKSVCVVSSDLHGRPNDRLWGALKGLRGEKELFLCTDFPSKAREFFDL